MKRVVTVVIVSCALLLPGTALASSSSTCQNYNPQLCSVQTSTSSTTTSSTLPFTGLDVVLLAAGGGTLLGAGLVVRKLSSRTDN